MALPYLHCRWLCIECAWPPERPKDKLIGAAISTAAPAPVSLTRAAMTAVAAVSPEPTDSRVIPIQEPVVVDTVTDASIDLIIRGRNSLAMSSSSSSSSGDSHHSTDHHFSVLPPVPSSGNESEPGLPVDSNNRREGPTIHVFQKSDQIMESKVNIPIHVSLLKRKADLSDTPPKIKYSPVRKKGDRRSTLVGKKQQTRARNSDPQEAIHGSAPSTKSFQCQSYIPVNEQVVTHPRTPRRVQVSKTRVSTTETVHTNGRGQLENHTRVQIEILDSDDETIADTPQQPQQPEPLAAAIKDTQKNTANGPASTAATDGVILVNQTAVDHTVLVATQAMAEEHKKDKIHVFNSEAFDAMMYSQSALCPPPGVASQAPTRPKTPVKKTSVGYQRQYLSINPAIHLPIQRSEEWHTRKVIEIQARGRRKEWFGKVIERRRWLRAKEKAEEDERNAAKESNQKFLRKDPQPWSYD